MKKIALLALSTVLLGACSQSATSSTAPSVSPDASAEQQNQYATPLPIASEMSSPSSGTPALVTPSGSPTPSPMTINLDQQNNSGESGTAVLSALPNGKLNVMINLSGGSITTPQPAHIHVGSCPNVGAVKYPLTDVANGVSNTNLTITFAQLQAMLATQKMAINSHESAAKINSYTSCGNLN
jgi:hypothetical protein